LYSVHANTASEAVAYTTQRILSIGEIQDTRGEPTIEACGVSTMIFEPLTAFTMELEGRDLKLGIGVVEGLSLLGETSAPEALTQRWRVFENFIDDGIFAGAYGIRAHGGLRLVQADLAENPASRRAVLTINQTHRDLAKPTRDVPCTLSIQFMIRGGKLNMFVSMRSNDVVLGLPYDIVMFAMLQAAMAASLGVDVGYYQHSAASSHIYEKHWDDAKHIHHRYSKPFDTPTWGRDSLADNGRWARGALFSDPGISAETEFEANVLELLK
jgi:thymidylate synthase